MSRRKPQVSIKAKRLVERFRHWSEEVVNARPDEAATIDAAFTRSIHDLLSYIEELEKRPPTVTSYVEVPDDKTYKRGYDAGMRHAAAEARQKLGDRED